jgi:GNAT superfamily N-acetyltransferase
MDARTILAAFEEQLRRNPESGPGKSVAERAGQVVRVMSEDPNGWAAVTWSALDEQSADAAIAAQIERFADRAEWEWKLYEHDTPADLPERLLAAGFEREEEEAVLVSSAKELLAGTTAVAPPEGVTLGEVRDRPSIRALLRLQSEVFGADDADREGAMLAGISQDPSTVAALMASAAGEPVAAARLEFYPGTDFAGLWGTCTHPRWERRGIFRALVAEAARIADERGFRWIQLDAVPESRAILLRLGFQEIARTTPFIYRNPGPDRAPSS